MMNSEIFKKYAEIAKEKGILREAEEKTNPRYDSNTITDIELLYGIKPNGKEDDKSIIEKAHPEPVIIAPAYDRVNGLVENEQELHNIMMGIVMKPHQGKLTNHRYAAAKSELMDELIRIGFMMDNHDEIELCKLADNCAENIVKQAALPLLLLIPLITAGVGALYTVLSQKITFPQGVAQDADKALVEIQEAVGEYPEIAPEVSEVVKHITKIKSLALSAFRTNSAIVRSNINSHDEKAVAEAAYGFIKSNSDEALIKNLEEYKAACERLMEEIPPAILNLKERLKQLEPARSDFFELGYKAYRAIVPSDMEDAWVALGNLLKSLSNQPALVDKNISEINNIRSKAEQVNANSRGHQNGTASPHHQDITIKSPVKQDAGTTPIVNQNSEDDDITKQLTNALLS